MGRKAKKKTEKISGVQKAIAVFTTGLVVIGIAVIAWLASKSPVQTSRPESSSPPAATSTEPMPEQAWLIVTTSSVKLVSLDGKRERPLSWPEDLKRLNRPLSQLKGMDLVTKETVWLDPQFMIASSSAMRSPDGRREAGFETDAEKTTLVIRYGSDLQRYPLRQKNGTALKNVSIIGWMDSQRIAIAAGNSSTSTGIYAVNYSNGMELLRIIPKEAGQFRSDDAGVYYILPTSASLGEKSSRLMLINNGKDEQLIQETENVSIVSYIADQGMVAYQTSDDELHLIVAGERYEIGSCSPLLLTKDEHVLCDEGWRYRLVGSEKRELTFPKQGAVFYLPNAWLDETVKLP